MPLIMAWSGEVVASQWALYFTAAQLLEIHFEFMDEHGVVDDMFPMARNAAAYATHCASNLIVSMRAELKGVPPELNQLDEEETNLPEFLDDPAKLIEKFNRATP